jgi:hypothetical protein
VLEPRCRSAIEPSTDGSAELTLETDDLAGLERVSVDVFGLRVLDRVWLAAGS